jgi:carnosine N-methyltransferase
MRKKNRSHQTRNERTKTSYIPNSTPLPSNNNQKESEEDERLEAVHFYTVLTAFALYEVHSFQKVTTLQNYFNHLAPTHKNVLLNEKEKETKFDLMKDAIVSNFNLIKNILPPDQCRFTPEELHPRKAVVNIPEHLKQYVKLCEEDMEKVHSTIKQCMRDWSEEGSNERSKAYGPIIEELLDYYSSYNTVESRSNIRVLTPGCGLGRLTWEISRLGFTSQGNEFSFYMLLAANFILNQVKQKDQFTIYPFVHQNVNVISQQDQLRPIKIPDVNPLSLNELMPPNKAADLSMVAGDFIEVYNEDSYISYFDCVATCFFIDTGKNIFEYIDVIYKILKPGGLWINLGPLLYHYADMPNTFSIELTYEEVKQVIQYKQRFTIAKEKQLDCTYCNNDKSMLQVIYKCMFFTAIKNASS